MTMDQESEQTTLSSSTRGPMHDRDQLVRMQDRIQRLEDKIQRLEDKIHRLEDKIPRSPSLHDSLCEEQTAIHTEIQASHLPDAPINSKNKGKEKMTTIDYMNEEFLWSGELKSRMREVWDIAEFRLCQQG
jgi:ATP-dependent DNA helicase Q1